MTLTSANDETIDFGYNKVTDLAITKTDGTTTYTPGRHARRTRSW